MAKRYFNWTMAIVLVVATVVLAVSAVALRGWQRKVRAERALPLAEQAYARGDWEEAARQFGQYVTIHGDDVAVLLKYAEAQLNRRPLTKQSITQARAVYSSILRFDRSNSEAAVALIELDLQMSAFREAVSIATQFLENQDDPMVRRLLGVAQRGLSQWGQAAVTLAGLVKDYPHEVAAYEVIGMLAEERPDDVNRPAEYWFDEAVRQNSDSALAYAIRAAFRRRHGDFPGALADLKQAETLDLTDTQVRLRLIAELANTDAVEEAAGQLEILRAQAPEEPGLYSTWAKLAMASGSAEQMATVAQTGLEALAKQPWDFMPVAAELYIQAGQYDSANECIARMREKGVWPAAVAYLEGRVAVHLGRLQEAVNAFRTAISLNYNDDLNRTYDAPPVRMALAAALAGLGDVQSIESAVGQMRTLISEALESDDPGAERRQVQGRLYLGQLLLRTGDWSGVIDEAHRVVRLTPDSIPAAVLEIQARIALLRANREPPGGPAWQELERQLVAVDEATNRSLPVGLLRVHAQQAQDRFAEASALLDELGRRFPDLVQIAQLRAALCVAEAQWHEKQGRAQQAAEKEEQAVSVLRQAIESFPQSTDPVLLLASLLERQEKVQECESVVTEAMARIEQPLARRDLGRWLATGYRRWKQDDKALQLLTALAQQYPADIQIKSSLLGLSSVARDPAAAQKLVDEIKQIEGPDGWQWRLEQARVWWINSETFKSRYSQIIALLQENVRANPGDILGQLRLATAYKDGGEIQPALATYRELLNRDPNNIRVILGAVDVLRSAGREDEASRVMAEAEQRNLYDPELRWRRLEDDLRLSSTAQDSEVRRAALLSASDTLEEMVVQDPNDMNARLKLAFVLIRQEKFEEAQVIVDGLKAANPQAVDVAEAQIQLYAGQGDREKAIRLCDETVQAHDNAAAYAIRAQTYAFFRQFDQALDDLALVVEREPTKPQGWLIRADFYQSLGRTSEALADARKALTLAPDNLNAQRLVVTLLMASGGRSDLLQAEKLLDGALIARPQDPSLRLLNAKLLLRKRTASANEQARRVLTALTESQPKLVEAWVLLGRLELAEQQPGRAIDLAARGLARNPGDKSLLLLKADAEWQRSPAVAIPTLRMLADQDPQDIDAIIRLGYAYVDSGRSDTAIELMRQSVARFEGAAQRRAEIGLATFMHRSGDKAGARALFDRLMESRPDDPAPVVALAQLLGADRSWTPLRQLMADWSSRHPEDVRTPILVTQGLYPEAGEAAHETVEALLRDVLQRHPESIDALHRLAILTQTTGRGEESAQLNRRIIGLDPNDVVAMNNLAWFLSENRQQYSEALALTNRGLTLAPDYADLNDTRGVIYHRMGRYEDAVRDFTACIRQYPDNAPSLTAARFHLGRTYLSLGRKAEAREELARSLNLHERIGGLTPSEKDEATRLLEQAGRAD
jgi:tetratricopeptide (TPR) repeat protein